MQVWIEDHKAIISCTFSEKEIVKAVGNYKFNKTKKVWEFPISSIVSIVDNLKIDTTKEVLRFYEILKAQEKDRKAKIEKAEKIKTGKYTSQHKSWDVCFSHQKQALALATLFDSYALFMDTGCVDGDTEIWDPDKLISIKIKDLAKERKPFSVLSITNKYPVKTLASYAFEKGLADLYKVNTGNGFNITCTLDHRFLTKKGWMKLKDLSVGDYVLTCGHSRASFQNQQQTNLEPCPLIQPLSDQHSEHTSQDFLSCYSVCYGLCGEQPQPVKDIFADDAPLLSGVLEHNYVDPDVDGQGSKLKHNHLCQYSDLLSKQDFYCQEKTTVCDKEYFPASLCPKDETSCKGNVLPFDSETYPGLQRPELYSNRSVFFSGPFNTSTMLNVRYRCQYPLYQTSWSKVKEITFVKNDVYYDLSVPHFGNYLANGFFNHNTGKSLTAIKLIEYWRVPTMIIAPLSILESVWLAEIAKWSNFTVVNLWHNLKELEKEYNVYLINYEHFKKIKKIPSKIQFLILDESSKLKNHKSQTTKSLLNVKDSVKHKLILSGKPAPNNLLEYWGQMAFVNHNLLGDNFYKFRNTYFYSTGYGGYVYAPYPAVKETIMKKVAEQAFFIQKEDCLDLPERVFETRLIEMDPEQQRAYNDMKEANLMEFKDNITLGTSELAKIMKLRQITSGFTITTDDKTVKISDTKVKELMNVFDELDDTRQVLIWVQFHFEIKMITDALKKAKKSYATLYGEMKQKDKEEAIDQFKSRKVTYLVAHPKSGGMGLNLQQCSYCVWFSMSYSEEEFYQANDRIYRKGQVNKCTYILLHAKRSIDGIIYKALLKKEKMTEVCLGLLKGNAL